MKATIAVILSFSFLMGPMTLACEKLMGSWHCIDTDGNDIRNTYRKNGNAYEFTNDVKNEKGTMFIDGKRHKYMESKTSRYDYVASLSCDDSTGLFKIVYFFGDYKALGEYGIHFNGNNKVVFDGTVTLIRGEQKDSSPVGMTCSRT